MFTLEMKPLLVAVLLLSGCFESQVLQDQSTGSPFFGMEPTSEATLLAPDLISSALDEYNGTFSEAGDEFFFTTNTPSKGIITYTSIGEDGHWTPAIVAPFSGQYSEYDPIFSPDGSRLYFTSERPRPNGKEEGTTHIWYVEKKERGWTTPVMVDLDMNGVYYSSFTNSGTLYFNHWNSGDMYRATELQEGKYQIDTLSPTINSQNGEGDPFVSPEEDYLIFRGYENSIGNGDLFISYRTNDEWSAPINLGEPINSPAHEMCPLVTTDGRFLIFASNRISEEYNASQNLQEVRDKFAGPDNGNLNVYYISADFIERLKPKL